MDQWPFRLVLRQIGPMALRVSQKFPPRLALVHGWLFPVTGRPVFKYLGSSFELHSACHLHVQESLELFFGSGTFAPSPPSTPGERYPPASPRRQRYTDEILGNVLRVFLTVSSKPCLETRSRNIIQTPLPGHCLGAL